MVNSLSLCSLPLKEQATLFLLKYFYPLVFLGIILPPALLHGLFCVCSVRPLSIEVSMDGPVLSSPSYSSSFTQFCRQFIQYQGFKYHCFSTYQFFMSIPDISLRFSICVLSSQHSIKLLKYSMSK